MVDLSFQEKKDCNLKRKSMKTVLVRMGFCGILILERSLIGSLGSQERALLILAISQGTATM